MFFFGLLSTHLPYIILTILYLVGFVAYSANNAKGEITDNIPNEKVIKYSPKSNFEQNPQSNLYYYNKTNQKHHKSVPISIYDKFVIYSSVDKYILFEGQTNNSSFHLIFLLFSRPPPISFS